MTAAAHLGGLEPFMHGNAQLFFDACEAAFKAASGGCVEKESIRTKGI